MTTYDVVRLSDGVVLEETGLKLRAWFQADYWTRRGEPCVAVNAATGEVLS